MIFSDGAWEPENSIKAGAGIVFIDPVQRLRLMREVEVDQRLLDKWLGIGKVQLITELELLPVLVGMAHYNGEIRGRRVLWFVDNNSVRDMLSKGSSASSINHTPWYGFAESPQKATWPIFRPGSNPNKLHS